MDIVGTNFSETLTGTVANDRIWGLVGNDSLYGYSGADQLIGGDGNDDLVGGDGNDKLWGGAGNDKLWGEAGDDQLIGGYGADQLVGGDGNDKLWGEAGDDKLWGGYGNDTVDGSYGNDYLYGFGGGYSVEIDTLTGGSGSDTFVIGDSKGVCYLGGSSNGSADHSYALIKDFSSQYDYIQAHGSSSNYHFGYGNWFGNSNQDTGIYRGNDLIAVVQDTTNVNFARDFTFLVPSLTFV